MLGINMRVPAQVRRYMILLQQRPETVPVFRILIQAVPDIVIVRKRRLMAHDKHIGFCIVFQLVRQPVIDVRDDIARGPAPGVIAADTQFPVPVDIQHDKSRRTPVKTVTRLPRPAGPVLIRVHLQEGSPQSVPRVVFGPHPRHGPDPGITFRVMIAGCIKPYRLRTKHRIDHCPGSSGWNGADIPRGEEKSPRSAREIFHGLQGNRKSGIFVCIRRGRKTKRFRRCDPASKNADKEKKAELYSPYHVPFLPFPWGSVSW